MLERINKQRFTVLLFLSSVFGGLSYIWSLPNFLNFLFNFDVMMISTTTLSLSLLVDKISLSFSSLICFISGCVFMFSRWYMKDDVFFWRFTWILLLFVMSMNILVFSGSLMMLLVGWDGLGVTSFALIIYYESKASLRAGFMTLLINRIGDVIIMSTMVFLTLQGMTLLVGGNMYMLLLFCLGGLTKSAQYPFSAWLPAAMAAPTPVSALVHSSTLVTAGVYILIRGLNTINISTEIVSILLFCGAMTSLLGGLCAVYENDLKKIIAYSTLSQLGVMMFSLGLGLPFLALLHLYTHAMFKAMLFLVAGFMLMMSYGVQDIRLLGSVLKNSPFLLVFLNTSSLCLMGVPYLSAYFSKHAILVNMMAGAINILSMIVMVVATILSSVYMIRMLKNLNWSTRVITLTTPPYNRLYMYSPLMLLYMGAVYFGSMMNMMDPVYTTYSILPLYVNLIMNSLLFVGVLMGVFIYKSKGVHGLATMFYLVPLWQNSTQIGNFLVHKSKSVEVGWIEPFIYMKSFSMFLTNLNKKSLWPNSSFSFTVYSIGFMFMMLYYVTY
uniref:NADH-ubiquinone oxidoreductase chain 5 n=1 Tax=Aegista aubryana TaxID=1789663 RepID=A0A109QSL3_9EUPU|nr:NADH dehydrogenase subunit 5 [Aegista aubryana]AMB49882.1 NADH dehydrogenase subunit 5 [Aegista aubryana]